jgi:hypothetical protein
MQPWKQGILWLVPPLQALLAVGTVASQPPNLLAVTGIELLMGLAWWALVVLPRRRKVFASGARGTTLAGEGRGRRPATRENVMTTAPSYIARKAKR